MPHPSPYADVNDVVNWRSAQASVVAETVDPHSDEGMEVDRVLSASSICIDKGCRRVFYQSVEETREIFPSWSPSYDVYIGDTVSISRVQVLLNDGTYEDVDPIPVLVPADIPYEPSEYMRFTSKVERAYCPRFRVTGLFGWSEVPDDVKVACVMLTVRTLARKSSPTGAGGVGGFVVQMDPDIDRMLGNYKNWKTE